MFSDIACEDNKLRYLRIIWSSPVHKKISLPLTVASPLRWPRHPKFVSSKLETQSELNILQPSPPPFRDRLPIDWLLRKIVMRLGHAMMYQPSGLLYSNIFLPCRWIQRFWVQKRVLAKNQPHKLAKGTVSQCIIHAEQSPARRAKGKTDWRGWGRRTSSTYNSRRNFFTAEHWLVVSMIKRKLIRCLHGLKRGLASGRV